MGSKVCEEAKSCQKPADEVSSKPLKPCCACPETKKKRDECVVLNGEENCKELIESHKECLRKHGFKV